MSKTVLTRRALLAAERPRVTVGSGRPVALLFPNRYPVAMSSLGYQSLWARLATIEGVAVERVVVDTPFAPGVPPASHERPVSLETGRPLSDFDLIAVSISDESDLANLAVTLAAAGLSPLAAERPATAPPVLAGGPLAASNPRPLGAFADAVLCGDSEGLLVPLIETALAAGDRGALAEALMSEPTLADCGALYLPEQDGDDAPAPRVVGSDSLPAAARVWTPHSALAEMFLVEASRGCSRGCTFCAGGRACGGERRAPAARVLARIPAEAPRVGFVGAAVSDHPELKAMLAQVVARGRGVGVSSVRADRLDDELVRLLVAGGARTLTVAADALSERLRGRIRKGITAAQLEHAAVLAARHKIKTLKLYALVGLPGEREDELQEFLDLCAVLRREVRLVVALNPFVPKRLTVLADEPMADQKTLRRRIERLSRGLRQTGVELRALSPRWAFVQWRLSQGGRGSGSAVWQAIQAGGRYADWRRALG